MASDLVEQWKEREIAYAQRGYVEGRWGIESLEERVQAALEERSLYDGAGRPMSLDAATYTASGWY